MISITNIERLKALPIHIRGMRCVFDSIDMISNGYYEISITYKTHSNTFYICIFVDTLDMQLRINTFCGVELISVTTHQLKKSDMKSAYTFCKFIEHEFSQSAGINRIDEYDESIDLPF
jgi:hypothetical protein